MIPMNQKVNVYFSDQGNDEWGLPIRTPEYVTYKCRLDFNADARIIQGDDGKDIVFSATIYFKGAVPIGYNDFIEYDSGVDGIKKINPRKVFPITDLAGKVTYTKVTI
ncbi:hypothetical protein ABEY65_28300 [Priestia aryabhattai]|uniref:hypothetical protein n=1 Tax=Priestia aryabhattai TaxID=412384 RepID=UPI003D28BA96